MKTLLLTGFEPFLDFPLNPSEQIVNSLHQYQIGEYFIEGRILPVEFAKSGPELLRYFEEVQPDAVISLGLAGQRNCISIERIAVNCIDGEADNRGVRYQDQPIVADGPAAYFSTLPIRKMIENLRGSSLPAEISNTAGLYLCNNVMYQMLHYLKQRNLNLPSGFIHVPATHELAVQYKRPIPSWDLRTLVEAVQICIKSLSE